MKCNFSPEVRKPKPPTLRDEWESPFVIDCVQQVSQAPQGLAVLRAILDLRMSDETMLTVAMIKSRTQLVGVSYASIYRTINVLHQIGLIDLMEYTHPVSRGPKPKGYDLTAKGLQIMTALFTRIAPNEKPTKSVKSSAPIKRKERTFVAV